MMTIKKTTVMMNGFSGGLINSILCFIYIFVSCSDVKKVKFEFHSKYSNEIINEYFYLDIITSNDSIIYLYDLKTCNGKDMSNQLIRYKFIINNHNYLQLFYSNYFNDSIEPIRAKYTGSKEIIVNKKIKIVDCFHVDDEFAELNYFFFNKEYGLLLERYNLLSDRILVKFDINSNNEIKYLIKTIKEDDEFYTLGGREYFAPPCNENKKNRANISTHDEINECEDEK